MLFNQTTNILQLRFTLHKNSSIKKIKYIIDFDIENRV